MTAAYAGCLHPSVHSILKNNLHRTRPEPAADGYAGYNRLLKRADQAITLAYCWAVSGVPITP